MSDETNNQHTDHARTPTGKSGGVFGWLTGSRSPANGSPPQLQISTRTSVRSDASGDSGSVSSASPNRSRTRSPASSTRSNSRSPPRSPGRRFVVPQLAMAGGGRFGPTVMMDMAPRTVYAEVDDDNDDTVDFDATITSTAAGSTEAMELPPSMQIKTKTVETPTENQLEEPLVVRYVTTAAAAGGDNQVEEPSATYVTTTVGGDNQTTLASPASCIRYITTTTTPGGVSGVQPPASPVRRVRYISKTIASPVRSPAPSPASGGVQYVTRTVAVEGASPASASTPVGASGHTSVRFFGSPETTQSSPNVHYVTRVVNGQSVQVPVPVGVPSHDHRVQYVTTPSAASGASPASSTLTAYSPANETHQHVRYIVKSNTPPTSVNPNQVQYVTTRTVAEGEARSPRSVPLSAVVASTVANAQLSPAHMTPAATLNLEGQVDGLPSRHFLGVALTDTDSSDGEDFEVKMVFDIMQQKFVPVNKRRAAMAAATAAASGAAVAEGAAAQAELEEKAPVPAAAATVKEDEDKGLAVAAAIGVTVALSASPKRKLDLVGTPKAASVPGSPTGAKKRTPSQSKREPSPRKFFASAAANEAPRVPDREVTLDLDADASMTQYAELRSPSNNPDQGSRLGHVGMLLKVRVCRWLLITLVSLAIIVFLMILFYKGVTLRKYDSSDYSNAKQYDMLDNYNSYVGVVASLFSKPIELLIAIVVPILFFSFIAKALLGPKLSPRVIMIMFSLSSVLTFLLTNGFHGINVQMRVSTLAPVIALTDLSLQLATLASLSALTAANANSNASTIVSESGVGNAVTNTVLRNVVATAVANVSGDGGVMEPTSWTSSGTSASVLCTNTVDYSSVVASSTTGSLSTTTVSTYGFPLRAWQDEMLPDSLPEKNYTLKLDKQVSATTIALNLELLPMRVRTAANLFLHSAHITRDVFRWFSADDSGPLDVQGAIKAAYGSATTGNGELTYVNVAELLNLTKSGNIVDETLATPTFLTQVQALYNKSLAGAANISRSEGSLEFSTVSLPNGYTYESVTSEIPLVKSFLSRRLKVSGSSFVEDSEATNETDIFYDLDIAKDCGPYAGACEVRRTEYDAEGNVYEPSTTIRAFALCNNSLGNDDVEVFFNGSQSGKPIAYTCDGKDRSGMLVISVSSRIVGEALIEGPSTLVPRLVAGMATLKNPRKVYSLTVGKLSWPTNDLALKFHAACALGVGKCTGLDYALTAALENATETISSLMGSNLRGAMSTLLDEEKSEGDEYLVVGADYLPLKLLSPFAYNSTEAADKTNKTDQSVSGYPLVTITKPLQPDTLFQNDGDITLSANFDSVSWKTTTPLSGSSCSATVEARLNSVLNNHYYIEHGVQPAYTAGMYFLFQDAVTRVQIALGSSGSLTTLRFASTVEFIEMHASIPLLNVVLTLIGCGFILIVSIVVAIRSARGKYSATESDDTYPYAPPESFARVKLDRALFPALVLKRRVIDMTPSTQSTATNSTGSPSTKDYNNHNSIVGGGAEGQRIDAFTVGELRLEHDDKEISVDVPYGK